MNQKISILNEEDMTSREAHRSVFQLVTKDDLYHMECRFERLLIAALRIVERHIMIELDDLTTEVTATEDAEESAVLLLTKLHDLLTAAGTDPAKLTALRDSLKAKTDALAAAIVANTPSA